MAIRIRPISKKLQEVAEQELNECTERMNEDLKHIREWLQKQSHLTIRSGDQWLVTFLRGCKWSLQRTKEKLDYFYTIRTLIPEVFTNRDPLDPLLQCMLEKGIIYPLPNTNGPGGPRIIFADYSVMEYDKMRCIDLFQLFFIVIDILMVEDDNFAITGETLIINYAKIPASFFLQLTPTILKKFITCWQNAYPLRLKHFIGINTPLAIEKAYNFCKPFLSKKLQDRIHLYSTQNNEDAYNQLPKSLFPMELGGENGSRSTAAKQWKDKIESYRDWFLEDVDYVSNENLRPGKPRTYNEEFDVEGSFRKLNLD